MCCRSLARFLGHKKRRNSDFGGDFHVFAASPCKNARLSASPNGQCRVRTAICAWLRPLPCKNRGSCRNCRQSFTRGPCRRCSHLLVLQRVFESRSSHGYARHRRRIAVGDSHCPFSRAIALWPVRWLARALHNNQIVVELFFIRLDG